MYRKLVDLSNNTKSVCSISYENRATNKFQLTENLG